MARKFFNQSVRVNKNTGRVTVTRRVGSVTTTESYSAEEWAQKNVKPKKQKQVKNKEEKQPNSLSKSIKNTGTLLTIMSLFFIFAGTGIFTLPIGIYLINLANKIEIELNKIKKENEYE